MSSFDGKYLYVCIDKWTDELNRSSDIDFALSLSYWHKGLSHH